MAEFVCAEYLWVSGKDTHHDLRSKVRTLPSSTFAAIPDSEFKKFDDRHTIDRLANMFPMWSFDGSSTDQALCCKGKGENTEIYIQPRRVWPHPFPFKHNGVEIRTFLVLSECFFPELPLRPTGDNTRHIACGVFDKMLETKPWFAMEQEYVIMDPKTKRPFNWPENGFPSPQGPYYCSNGAAAWGRHIAEEHLAACVYMGVRISGLNAEVLPSQWEYQVGPSTGIEAGDHAVAARWLLIRVAAQHGLDIAFESKPVRGDWNGSGMHTNYSTEEMRKAGGIAAIHAAIAKIDPNHPRDVLLYGDDNKVRLTGLHETSSMTKFTSGVGTRNTSCRIPVQCAADGCGYLEDRRPSASADPYLVTATLFASSMGFKDATLESLKDHKKVELGM